MAPITAMKAMKSMKAMKAMKAVKTSKSPAAEGVKKTDKKKIPVTRIFDTTMTADDAAFLYGLLVPKYVEETNIGERERLIRLLRNLGDMQEQLRCQ